MGPDFLLGLKYNKSLIKSQYLIHLQVIKKKQKTGIVFTSFVPFQLFPIHQKQLIQYQDLRPYQIQIER